MGKFFQEAETCRIDFPDGEWVDIKEELSQEDQDYILNQMAEAATEEDEGKTKVTLMLGRLAMLERSIVAWSFSVDGQPVPVSRDNINRLRVKYRQKVLDTANDLYEAAGEFTSKNR